MQELQDDIILAFRQGERTAFDAIYDQLHKPIITFCKYMVPVEDAEDITAEIFFKLWKSRKSWDSIKNVKAFLYRSARNACINYLRQQKSKSTKHKQLGELMAGGEELILRSELESELINRIRQEIENLPPSCKTVFTLSYFEGYKTPEIAEKLSISAQTVKNLKSAALKAVRISILKKGLQVNLVVFMLQIAKRVM